MAYIGKYPVRMPQVGDYYQGGIIFHISGQDETGLHGLIAATTDQSTGTAWSNITNTAVTGTSNIIGTGMDNTLKIIGQPGHTASAASLCRAYTGGGFTDWYLPGSYEFGVLAIVALGMPSVSFGLASTTYWTSKESSSTPATSALSGNPITLALPVVLKSSVLRVRAIRSF